MLSIMFRFEKLLYSMGSANEARIEHTETDGRCRHCQLINALKTTSIRCIVRKQKRWKLSAVFVVLIPVLELEPWRVVKQPEVVTISLVSVGECLLADAKHLDNDDCVRCSVENLKIRLQ